MADQLDQRRRRRRSPELERTWRDRIAAWEASGTSVREFCREHELSAASFYSWRRQLRTRDGGDEVVPTETPTPAPMSTSAFLPVAVAGAACQARPKDERATITIDLPQGGSVTIIGTPPTEIISVVLTALVPPRRRRRSRR